MLSFYLSILENEEDQQKMTDIYEKYKYYCIYIANIMLHGLTDAEDATHAAFMEIIKHKGKYFAMECSVFRAHLVVIVKRKAIDIIRLRKKESAHDEDSLSNTPDEDISIEYDLLHKEEYELLRKALKELTPSYSNILTMKYFEDLSNAEIADALQTNKKNVEVKLTRARISLRKALLKIKGAADETTRV